MRRGSTAFSLPIRGSPAGITQPDHWQSDISKGIALARPEYLSFQNADDYYDPGALSRVVDIIKNLPRPASSS